MATLLLEAFIITITECFSDEISEPEISNHILKREGTLDLSKDEGFIELYNLVSDYSKTSKNAEQINHFISKLDYKYNISNIRQNELDSIFITGFEGIETSSDDCTAIKKLFCKSSRNRYSCSYWLCCFRYNSYIRNGLPCRSNISLGSG